MRRLLIAVVVAACAQGNVDEYQGRGDIEVRELFTIADANGMPARDVMLVFGGPAGTVLSTELGSLGVHSQDGRLLRRIGKQGRRPGELGRISAAFATADTIHVIDQDNHRLTRLDREGNALDFIDLPAQRIGFFLPLPGGRTVINASLPEVPGSALHILDGEGRIVTSFGADTSGQAGPVQGSGDARSALLRQQYVRYLAFADSSSFWSAARQEYLIERWSFNGARLQTIHHQPNWFPGTNRTPVFHPDTVPAPQLLRVWPNGDLLWVVIRVADRRWSKAVGLNSDRGGTIIEDWKKAFDTIVEVLDRSNGDMLHSARLDENYRAVLPDGRLVGAHFGQDDKLYLTIHRASIRSASATGN